MDLLDLIRINKTVQSSNKMENKPADAGLVSAVTSAAKQTVNTAITGLTKTSNALSDKKITELSKNIITAAVPGTSLDRTALSAAKTLRDTAKSTIDATKNTIVDTKELLKRLFAGDIDLTRYEAYAAALPALTGELNQSEMAQLRSGLMQMYPNVYSGADVNDATQIESTIIRPVSMILGKHFGIPAQLLASALKMIAFYEVSLKGAIARTAKEGKPCGVFQYIPSVLKRMTPSLGAFIPGKIDSEITYAVNYFGDLLKTISSRFKTDAASDVPVPTIFKEQAKNAKLREKLAVLPFVKNKNVNTVLLMITLHRSGYNPDGIGYSNENLNEILTKRVPAFIQSYVFTKQNKDSMYA